MDHQKEWDALPKAKRKKLKRALRRQGKRQQARLAKMQNLTIRTSFAVAFLVIGYVWWTKRSVLPPTDIVGHVEEISQSHILDKPMPIAVQKHMLEHADGNGPPGVVINYNCVDFDCEAEMIGKLIKIANQYPEFVYVAPFSGMTKKLAVTRYGKIETFDALDEKAIIRFIEQR